jgi:hypothetical protein
MIAKFIGKEICYDMIKLERHGGKKGKTLPVPHSGTGK